MYLGLVGRISGYPIRHHQWIGRCRLAIQRGEEERPADVNAYLLSIDSKELSQKGPAVKVIQRPGVELDKIMELMKVVGDFDNEVTEQAELQLKYSGYINRERESVEKSRRLEHLIIPKDFNYLNVLGMSTESRLKLEKLRPSSIGEASRVSGVSPNDISVLLVFIGR